MEIFKMIEGYNNYMISSWGNVYRIETQITMYSYSKVKIRMNPEETKKGYLRVRLVKNGQKKWFKVHRLVAQAFIENPKGKSQVNHKDGNKKNNSVTNLEWVTDAENKEHQKRMNNGIIA